MFFTDDLLLKLWNLSGGFSKLVSEDRLCQVWRQWNQTPLFFQQWSAKCECTWVIMFKILICSSQSYQMASEYLCGLLLVAVWFQCIEKICMITFQNLLYGRKKVIHVASEQHKGEQMITKYPFDIKYPDYYRGYSSVLVILKSFTDKVLFPLN